MNKSVSFKLAKLLNKRQINVPTQKRYRKDGFFQKSTNDGWSIGAPTIADVVMWLYDNKGIWIWSSLDMNNNFYWTMDNGRGGMAYRTPTFQTPTEAYEVAIEYVVNNLI